MFWLLFSAITLQHQLDWRTEVCNQDSSFLLSCQYQSHALAFNWLLLLYTVSGTRSCLFSGAMTTTFLSQHFRFINDLAAIVKVLIFPSLFVTFWTKIKWSHVGKTARVRGNLLFVVTYKRGMCKKRRVKWRAARFTMQESRLHSVFTWMMHRAFLDTKAQRN